MSCLLEGETGGQLVEGDANVGAGDFEGSHFLEEALRILLEFPEPGIDYPDVRYAPLLVFVKRLQDVGERMVL